MKSVQLECVLCNEFYTEIDIENFRFFPSTRVCYNCYRQMQKQDYAISCFGKKTEDKKLGYNGMAEECRELCPDRRICPNFVNRKYIRLRVLAEQETVEIKRQPTIRQYPFRPTSLLCKAFKLCMKDVSLTVLKRWCRHRNKKHDWVLRVLRKEQNKKGLKWKLHESSNAVRVEFPLSR